MTDEAVARYEFACERLNLLRGRWEAAGRPFTAKGTRGAEVEHPLHKVLRLQEILVDRLAARARPGRVGRPPEAVPGLPPPLSCIVVVGEVRLHEKSPGDPSPQRAARALAAHRADPGAEGLRLPSAPCCGAPPSSCRQAGPTPKGSLTPATHFAAFCETLTQSEDRWEGEPFKLEPWQRRFWREALGDWRSVVPCRRPPAAPCAGTR
jgi:hypothetical protein